MIDMAEKGHLELEEVSMAISDITVLHIRKVFFFKLNANTKLLIKCWYIYYAGFHCRKGKLSKMNAIYIPIFKN